MYIFIYEYAWVKVSFLFVGRKSAQAFALPWTFAEGGIWSEAPLRAAGLVTKAAIHVTACNDHIYSPLK